ncbi:MAG TPA: cytidine deaminase [Candidatus Dormibacteraeota bacterium]|nr:cytidine deaminase [Candidatus Dormibacteraeota bacterium]
MDTSDEALIELARRTSENAYAPYSRFRVGAAVRTEAGGVYTGCNVENASYGLTCCAERNAVFAAVAAEGPGMRLVGVAVHAEAHTVPPCGACRQVIAEFGPQARVLFPSDGAVTAMRADELLPGRFEFEPPG